MNNKILISDILNFLNRNKIDFQFKGDSKIDIFTFSPLKSLKNNSITWARNSSNLANISLDNLNNVVIFLSEFVILSNSFSQILVSNPHKVYFLVIKEFFETKDEHLINKTAILKTSKIGSNLNIGEYSFVGKDVIIGNNVFISNNVSIQGNVLIGDDCVIESGVKIGVDGFGHYRDDTNVYIRVPHLGGVFIGSNVIIGANCTIVRGCLGDTIIDDYVRIDNLVHIAHNVHIKTRSMITAGTVVSGSTIIEEDVWVGPRSVINNGLNIGKNSIIGIGSVVTRNILPGKLVLGYPAIEIKDNE
jgi:UDP-3-O-[3-hydroxymyristoyl] glucosamine N-acyltransferase